MQAEGAVLTKEEMTKISPHNSKDLNQNKFIDINTVCINNDLPHKEKVATFLTQIKNPYCYMCNDITINLCFSNNSLTLDKILKDFFISLVQR